MNDLADIIKFVVIYEAGQDSSISRGDEQGVLVSVCWVGGFG